MKLTSWASLIFLLIVFVQQSEGQQLLVSEPELFLAALPPAVDSSSFPQHSGFLKINNSAFSAASIHEAEVYTIHDFPLGTDRVTLHVDQFDVVRKDTRVVLGTSRGDIPSTAPPHVLLHGSVEGYENSYVYLAVFDSYALGYIDIPIQGRYLIQPTTMSSDAPSTLVVYKQNDISRPPQKWMCGTEDYAANFPLIEKISAEIGKSSNIPEIQGQRMVHLLNIAIDCDHEYFVTLGSDVTRAQNYAIAVLGAHSDIYTRDLNCGVTAGYLRVWTTDDPYPGDNTNDMLGEFVDYWNSNMANVTRAAALLYSSHGGGGLAYIGTLCSVGDGSLGYGVCGLNTGFTFPSDGYIWDVDVSSHEFGHICGSLHTHNCAWKPPVDSCVSSEGGCYANPNPRRGTIMSYCHLTAFGTELKFHPRVITFLKSIFNKSTCASYVELPIANAGPDAVLCHGGSATLGGDTPGGTPPFTYSWRPSIGLSSTDAEIVTAKPSQSTTYITSVTDGNMLRTYDTVNVVIEKPVVNAGGDVTVCGLGKYILTGAAQGYPPFTYQWIDTGLKMTIGTTAKLEIPIAKTRTYRLVVTDSIGCVNSDMMTITVASKPVADITPSSDTSICAGGNLTLDAGVQATNYLWSNGAKTRTINVTSSGSYFCIVRNSGVGCDDTSRIISVTFYPVPTVPAVSQVGDTLISTPANAYQWYEGSVPIAAAIDRKYVPTKSGTYLVKTRNENNCSAESPGFVFAFNSHADVPYSSDPRDMINVYPNPAHDQIYFDYPRSIKMALDLQVTTLLGNKLAHYSRSAGENADPLMIDIHAFPTGTYILNYSFGAEVKAVKFVKE